MTTDLVVSERPANPYAIMPVMDFELAAERRFLLMQYTKKMLVEGQDYGKIPGAGDKATLLKPGAEKLASLFGLSPLFEVMERDMDWTGERHGGEPFFYVAYRCTLTRGELVAGQGVGSCNSWEKKYRYRQGERTCPECGKAAIIRGKEEYGGGWLCFKKRDGCGYKFAATDPRIIGQQVGQVKNPDPADIVNTIEKMAQKRALVAAVLIAVNASEMFTQDIEDGVIDAEWTPSPEPPAAPKAAPAADPGPLAEDEQVIAAEPAARFIAAAAGLLETNTDTLKARLKALGYTSIPGHRSERLAAYRKLRADLGAHDDIMQPAQGSLVTVEDVPRPGSEYQD